jgi:hypothetical protein
MPNHEAGRGRASVQDARDILAYVDEGANAQLRNFCPGRLCRKRRPLLEDGVDDDQLAFPVRDRRGNGRSALEVLG